MYKLYKIKILQPKFDEIYKEFEQKSKPLISARVRKKKMKKGSSIYTTTAKYIRYALSKFIPVIKELIEKSKNKKESEDLTYRLEDYLDIAKRIDDYKLNLEDPSRYYKGEPNEINLEITTEMLEHLVRLTLKLLNKWKDEKEKLELREHLTEERKERLARLKSFIRHLEPLFDAQGYVFHDYKGKGSIEFPGEKLPEKDNEKYDIFICHASEDKEPFVEPLAKALQKAGIRVWYDDFVLEWGDDLLPSINKGVVKSRYGIVVFSKSFLKMKKKWTKYELNSLFAKEKNGRKVILPIWYDITREDLLEYAPGFADRIAKVSSKDSINDIVNDVKKLLQK